MRSVLKIAGLAAAASLIAGAVAAQTTITYTNSTPVAILDVATVTSTITVPDGDWGNRDTVRDLNVAINITHTWDGDLNVSLSGPDGTVIQLWTAIGGSGDNFNVTIDDEAASNMAGTTGTWRPETYPSEALCKLDALAPGGVYTLTVQDAAGGDIGFINSWSITIEGDSGHFKNDCASSTEERVRRGLGSWANNGKGNGEDFPPPGSNRH